MAAVILGAGCVVPKQHNLPPAQRLLEPGPGVGGPGPGVIGPYANPGTGVALAGYNGGADGACNDGSGGGAGGADGMMMPASLRPDVQVAFSQPDGMQIRFDTTGQANFDGEPLVSPAKQNMPQDGIYRMKLTNIPGREGVELYPTLEVAFTTPRTAAYLAHNTIPVRFTEEDFEQVAAGNYVTKVIYLPDPEFQELALAGVDTLVSTRLDPGVDPIDEADRRGSIMAIVRVGNKDIELPGSDGSYAGTEGYDANGVACGPDGQPNQPVSLPNPHVAGYTAPQYGMPYVGTPIGLPGPAHIPLGGPAGLQRHIMKNHTHEHYPDPTHRLTIHVRNQPGYSYPRPPSRVFIREQSMHAAPTNGQPHYDRNRVVR